jgi:hypothetical protein
LRISKTGSAAGRRHRGDSEWLKDEMDGGRVQPRFAPVLRIRTESGSAFPDQGGKVSVTVVLRSRPANTGDEVNEFE